MALTLTARPRKALPSGKVLLLLPAIVLYGGLFMMPLAKVLVLSFENGWQSYRSVLSSPIFIRVVENTFWIGVLTTVLAVTMGYAVATLIWRSARLARVFIIAVVLLPFWTSVLIKNFAWSFFLQDNGIINTALIRIGLIEAPLHLLHNRFAVVLGMVHYVLPFAVFPILTVLISLDTRIERAARSLGASGFWTMIEVTLPLARQGIYAATLLVFIISTSFYITPVLLGSPRDMMISNLVNYYTNTVIDFGAGAALSMMILLVAGVFIGLYQSLPKGGQHG